VDDLQEALKQATKGIAALAAGPGVAEPLNRMLLPLSALFKVSQVRSPLPKA